MDIEEKDTVEETNSDEIEELRRFVDECWPVILEKMINIIAVFQEDLAKQNIGPRKSRIGAFGPYPGINKEIIMEVARYVSDFGFASITGDGFYLPNNESDFHDIKEISHPAIIELFNLEDVPQYNYYRVLPRLVQKAIFLMNEERGQTVELIGCFEERIPVLGFIVHNITTYGDLDCIYLSKKGEISSCTVRDHLSCPGIALKRPRCPFYDSIDIPWLFKELFLRRKANALIAVKRVQDLRPVIKNFIVKGMPREFLLENIEEEL